MNDLKNFINQLKLGKPQNFGRLTIMPVISKGDFTLPFLTLEEALEKGVLEITEKDTDGQVSELRVVNRGREFVILIEGEELIGAKQNRIVNTTTIVAPKTEIMLPVTCVERGRWRYTSSNFSASPFAAGGALRKVCHDSVAESLKREESHHSDQGAVWGEISDKAFRLNIESETEASADIANEVLRSIASNDFDREIHHEKGQIGFIAYIDGGLAVCDIFGSEDLCSKKLGKFARGYYTDAVEEDRVFPKIEVEEFLKEVSSAMLSEYPTIGIGRELRFENKNIRGACKLVGESVSHLSVFPKD